MSSRTENSSDVRLQKVVVRNVVKTFGSTAALRGVDATFGRGVLTLIEGPNGSGKSTLLRIIGTILRPTRGTVEYPPLGTDLRTVRKQLGWLSHDSLVYGDLTGQENIQLAARLHGRDPVQSWEKARERFELGSFAERAVRTNSRGQRQRIALARALINQPALLLLDEPTTGLDKSGVERLLGVVESELAAGSAVAVVSHESQTFAELSTRRIVLERGQVINSFSI